MGWWSATIMGGDTPLDYLGSLAESFGLSYSSSDQRNFHGYQFTREMLEDKSAVRKIESVQVDRFDEYNFWEVVGATYLWAGAKMPSKVKRLVLKAAKGDEWAKTDPERRGFVNDFIQKVQNHNGEVVELADEGLMARIATALSGGHS